MPPLCQKPGECFTPKCEPLGVCPQGVHTERYLGASGLLLAENACVEAMDSRAGSRMKDPYKEDCREIDHRLEHLLSLPPNHNELEKVQLFQEFVAKLTDTRQQEDIYSKSRTPYAMQIEKLGIFLPAFRARIFRTEISKADMLAIHGGLCESLASFDNLYLRNIPRDYVHERKRMLAERAEREVWGLMTRIQRNEYFSYPALTREEQSQHRPEFNHDGYCIKEGIKVPIQVKSSSNGNGYGGNVLVVRHYDILRAMNAKGETVSQSTIPGRQARHMWTSQHEIGTSHPKAKVPTITHLLLAEYASGNKTEQHIRNMLTLGTVYLTSRIDEFAARRQLVSGKSK